MSNRVRIAVIVVCVVVLFYLVVVLARSGGADDAGICPDLRDDYALCSGDPYSPNCQAFVIAAVRLGERYRAQLASQPDSEKLLQETVWWGCGTAGLPQITALLSRVPSQTAREALGAEPYRSLAAEAASAPGTPPAVYSTGCADLHTPEERGACADRDLAAAQSALSRALQACQARLGGEMGSDLADAEAKWAAQRQTRCEDGAGAGADREFERSSCLADAAREAIGSLHRAHPVCTL